MMARPPLVDTTPGQAWVLKRGVCQDFPGDYDFAARWCLRIPAGHVSVSRAPFLPPGKERLEGADAMHACASGAAKRTAISNWTRPTISLQAAITSPSAMAVIMPMWHPSSAY